MATVTLEPLRWRDPPAQVTVTADGGPPRVRFQTTAPREVAAMCRGRPVEELPRILTYLSPAHHLCAAEALDRLFGVEPPPFARNVREALRLALVVGHHLRKVYFLGTSLENPFAEFWSAGARRGSHGLRAVLEDLMRHVSLAREAATILGGRADHPVTAVPGGVSRALKPEHHARLGEIAASCRGCAERLGGFLRERVLAPDGVLGDLRALSPGPLASLALAAEPDGVLLRHASGETERFGGAAVLEKIGLQREPWSHEPFAFLKTKGWKDLDAGATDALLLVGPLARLNAGAPAATPRADAERQRLFEALGPAPRFEVAAAWWALLVELVSASEGLVALCEPDKLTGPVLRTVPRAPGREGHAVLEAPQGLIFHHFRADARGVVEEVRVIDAATANNGLHAVLARKAVETARARNQPWDETKKRIELALLPF